MKFFAREGGELLLKHGGSAPCPLRIPSGIFFLASERQQQHQRCHAVLQKVADHAGN